MAQGAKVPQTRARLSSPLSSPWFYFLVALATAGLGVTGKLLGLGAPYVLPWFMFTVAILSSLSRLAIGLGAAMAIALLLASFGYQDPVAWAILLLSAWLAHGVGENLRQAHRRAKALGRSLTLLTEALAALPEGGKEGSQAPHPMAFLEKLPKHLAPLIPKGHVGVWIPEGGGFKLLAAFPEIRPEPISDQGGVGRAFREGKPAYLPDTAQDPDCIPESRSGLALPLYQRGEVVAVLSVEKGEAFLEGEARALTRFAQAVSLYLDHLTTLHAQRLMADMGARLQVAWSKAEGARKGLEILLQALGLEAGLIWEVRRGRMEALAYQGVPEASLPEMIQKGLDYGKGPSWQVYRTGSPIYTERYAEEGKALEASQTQGLVTHPIPTPKAQRTRRVLVVAKRGHTWRQAEKELLLLATQTLGLGLAALEERERHQAIGALFMELLEKPMEALYAELLEKAVTWVPGSEAGSLLVWEEEEGVYRYQAAVGYNLPELRGIGFSQEAMAQWYGLGEEELKRGRPRIRRGDLAMVSYRTAPREVMDTAGRVQEIRANLCLPMPYKGKILAYLNLDNLHDEEAFGEDSLEAAWAFAAPLATLLHEAQTRSSLERAALTDPLTGLPNRRAFDQALRRELARAKRHGYPLSLLVMDLSGFKGINDHLGHAAGDEALIQVGKALLGAKRGEDQVFRWGGDEFAALLPHTPPAGAIRAAFRYAEAIQRVAPSEHPLGVNIGVASYPEDGEDPDTLLSKADTRMYQAKARGTTVAI